MAFLQSGCLGGGFEKGRMGLVLKAGGSGFLLYVLGCPELPWVLLTGEVGSASSGS